VGIAVAETSENNGVAEADKGGEGEFYGIEWQADKAEIDVTVKATSGVEHASVGPITYFATAAYCYKRRKAENEAKFHCKVQALQSTSEIWG